MTVDKIDSGVKLEEGCLLIDLGLRGYREVWDLQHRLVDRRVRREIPDTLILVEHPHVITLGRKGRAEGLSLQGLPLYRIERGGEATYHGPGQLVGYPILSLEENRMGIREYVSRLEEALIHTLADFKIRAGGSEKYPGVWVGGRKIASIGIAISHWVTYHGFALNVNTDLKYFNLIKPCGLGGSIMTSMERVLGQEVPLGEVKERFTHRFREIFHKRITKRPFDLEL